MPESDAPATSPRPEQGLRMRGTREGLTIALGGGELAALVADLEQHLRTQGAFFRGGRVALECHARAVDRLTLERIAALLQGYDMILRTVVTSEPTTRQAAQALGLRIIASPEAEAGAEGAAAAVTRPGATTAASAGTTAAVAAATPALSPAAAPGAQEGTRAVLLQRVIRSGQTVRHTGHVVVVGDVNPGAAVIAGGNIVVWGRLNGMAHAGSMGDESAYVGALEMSPTQLRIGNVIARPEEAPAGQGRKSASDGYAEMARVRDGTIVVEPWHKVGRGA
ncbi:MAG: septum site-determining protein MinC [Chloroflexota bacterium]